MQRVLHNQWTFNQLTSPSDSAIFEPIESATKSRFLLSLIESKVNEDIRLCNSTPIKKVGVAIPKPNYVSDLNRRVSTCKYFYLVTCVKGQESFDPVHYSAVFREAREEVKSWRQLKSEEALRKYSRGLDKK